MAYERSECTNLWLTADATSMIMGGRRVRTAIVFGALHTRVDAAWPSRNQLMTELSARIPVVLLEQAPPSRALLDLSRPRVEPLSGDMWVMRNAYALRTRRLGRRLSRATAYLDGRWARRALAEAGFDDFVLWLMEPNVPLAYGLRRERLAYDCIDPNFVPEHQSVFDKAEAAVARRARVVFATAKTLQRRMQRFNNDVTLLPNAAPVARAHLVPATRPVDLPDGPVVGYLGTIDWRFEPDSVGAAARALPHVTFVLAGRVNADQSDRLNELISMPNVVFPGALDTDEGDAYVASFDVGIIPFTPGEMNDAINPVKMFMYLAAGLPVVSTWIAECRDNPHVNAAHDPYEFAELVRDALNDNDPAKVAARRAFAASNTWAHRAEAAIAVLRDRGMVQ